MPAYVFFACKQYAEGEGRIGAVMCHVAETNLTLKNMNCVWAEILHEMPFFGCRQGDMEAEELKRAIRTAGYEYDLFCGNREIKRVRETVRASDNA